MTTIPEHLVIPYRVPGEPISIPVHTSAKSQGGEKAGGTPVIVDRRSVLLHCSVDAASDGTLYAAGADQNSGDGWSIRVHRSQDGGDTWTLWGELTSPSYSDGFSHPHLRVAEGSSDMCYIVYERTLGGGGERMIRLVGSPLSLETADFSTEVTVMSQVEVDFMRPRLFIDDDAFPAYYMYVVAEGHDGAGTDIWFARSVNLGVFFESEYEIATTPSDDRGYYGPDVAYGHDGYVHVSWYFTSHVDAFNDCICYRRAPDYANGGLVNWDILRTLTSPANGIEEYNPRLAASLADGPVVISYSRVQDMGDWNLRLNCGVLSSVDEGAVFAESYVSPSMSFVQDAAHDPDGARWVFAGQAGSNAPCLQTAPHADPTDWSTVDVFEDHDDFVNQVALCLDPGHGGDAAVVWTRYDASPSAIDHFSFDAEWRDGPGHPVPLDGFPLALDGAPTGAPAVVDVDGDSDLEIVFATDDDYLHAVNHDGTELPGWPVDLVFAPTDGAPVAVGPVGPDGETFVIVGFESGSVRAYDALGTQRWARSGMGGRAFVSIGAMGPPFPYMVVAAAGLTINFLGPDGWAPDGVATTTYSGSGSVTAPAAIGDVDGDGVAEAVFGFENDIVAHEMRDRTTFWVTIPDDISAGVTLKDFDQDGDQEVHVPTLQGFAYMLNDAGAVFGAWTIDTGTWQPLSELAVAQVLGDELQEIAFSVENGDIHLFGPYGTPTPFFPVYTGNDMAAGPIIGLVGGGIDLIYGTIDGEVTVMSSTAGDYPGWPQVVDGPVRYSPALGDLDQDGVTDLVWLTDASCYAVSLGQSPASDVKTWPMSRHDAKRTGCSDCPEQPVTGVDEIGPEPARVSFRAPSPNPVSSSTVFAFSLPVRAVVELEIVDSRGRRIRTVGREDLPPGDHIMSWDGRLGSGQPAAAGHYLARLRARGPGLDDRLTRKVTVIR